MAAVSLVLVGMLRVLRYPTPYAVAQALITYEHGFVRRGLYGTLFMPMVALQGGPRAIHVAFGVASLGLVMLAAVLVLDRAQRAVGTVGADVRSLVPLVFLASPAFLLLLHCIGYADILLFVAGLLAGAMLRRERCFVAGLLVALACLTHELALVICVPPLVVAIGILALRDDEPSAGEAWKRLMWFLAPPLAAALLLVVAGDPTDAQRVAIESSVLSHRVVLQAESGSMFHFLHHSLGDALTMMGRIWREDRADVLYFVVEHAIHLPIVLVGIVAVDAHVARQTPRCGVRLGLGVVALVAVLSPTLLHLVAWDANRIGAFIAYATFLLWAAVDGDPLPEGVPAQGSRRLGGALAIAAPLCTVAVPTLFDDLRPASRTTMERSLKVRWGWAQPKARYESYEGRLLFAGASFEEGAPVHAWRGAPPLQTAGPHPQSKQVVIPDGERYLSVRGTRTILSRSFIVEGDRIMAKIGGWCGRKIHVELVRLGDVRRFPCPQAETEGWDDLRLSSISVGDLRGQRARIRVVSRSMAAHVNVDGFRYLERIRASR